MTPGAEAVTTTFPAVLPSASVVEAVPSKADATTAGFTVPPPVVTAKDTGVPLTGLPLLAVTFTTSCLRGGLC